MIPSGMILVVEDHELMRRALGQALKARNVVFAKSVAQARRTIDASDAILAAVVDIGLPDGSGLEVIQHLRDRHGLVPTLVLTGSGDPETINRVHAAKAQLVLKSASHAANLEAFIHEAELSNIAYRVSRFALRVNLSDCERRTLLCAAQGTPRTHLHLALDVTKNTVKTYITRIFKKSGHGCWNDLVVQLQNGQLEPTASHAAARQSD
jgi:two-component system OmpR family response regulator